jgi:hypothetical protein
MTCFGVEDEAPENSKLYPAFLSAGSRGSSNLESQCMMLIASLRLSIPGTFIPNFSSAPKTWAESSAASPMTTTDPVAHCVALGICERRVRRAGPAHSFGAQSVGDDQYVAFLQYLA